MQCALRVIAGGQSWNRKSYLDVSASLEHVPYPPHPAEDFTLRITFVYTGGSHQRERPFCQTGFGGVILHHTVKALCQRIGFCKHFRGSFTADRMVGDVDHHTKGFVNGIGMKIAFDLVF